MKIKIFKIKLKKKNKLTWSQEENNIHNSQDKAETDDSSCGHFLWR